ncbi:endonuclease [Sporosarcina sp. P37]|uniref:GIY-YIG nuclease family protein n=1 Tax=unclassified Sporosarcina TaxID=2647733 RepID=UPI0009C0B22C|nr:MULTISPECIES: GIY-YIG nuclease family protein [unclassified Sporosarcina]ARD48439.1 endonuclease [Sporosarcina sp. P33]ARK24944.1 endonuclease [Sporosarcina sp. P37]PID18082.1 GIY-YIG nuclease family protein [Sporosarcina sp. P35]
MGKNEHFFYVLECNDGSYYAGYTNDLDRRLRVHNEGKGAKYTRGRLPVRYVYQELFETQRGAMQAEYQFKQLSRAQKEQYITKERCT